VDILKREDKTVVVLKDGDILEVQTLQGNPLHIEIKCINGSFLIDEVTIKRIKEVKLEQEQLDILLKESRKKDMD